MTNPSQEAVKREMEICGASSPVPDAQCSRELGHDGAHMGSPRDWPQANLSWGHATPDSKPEREMESGPSGKAAEAAVLTHADTDDTLAILRAAHDPALGLDASVCKRDIIRAVVEALRTYYGPEYSPDDFADFIEHKFGSGGSE